MDAELRKYWNGQSKKRCIDGMEVIMDTEQMAKRTAHDEREHAEKLSNLLQIDRSTIRLKDQRIMHLEKQVSALIKTIDRVTERHLPEAEPRTYNDCEKEISK